MFTNNSVHDNNNPNVPSGGSAAFGPVGSGVVIAGGRNDIVTHNAIFNNNAWGVLLAPYPDTELPPAEANPGGERQDLRHGRARPACGELPATQAAPRIAEGDAVAFEPRPGRRMKEWAAVDVPSALGEPDAWRQLMADARTYVGGLA